MCSEYGRSIATKLGKLLADKDVQVISGMALGIDSASHAGALQGKGSTFAVLGCGCDVCYPKNARNLYENIQSSGGGILSEYPPGTKPMPYRFPERNRIISALSDCLVVVEAKKKSGSLITADAALELHFFIFHKLFIRFPHPLIFSEQLSSTSARFIHTINFFLTFNQIG